MEKLIELLNIFSESIANPVAGITPDLDEKSYLPPPPKEFFSPKPLEYNSNTNPL